MIASRHMSAYFAPYGFMPRIFHIYGGSIMKTSRERSKPFVKALSILLSVLTVISIITVNPVKASAAASSAQPAMYLFKTKLKITNLPSEHSAMSGAPDRLPYDIVSGVSSSNAYAPFDCTVIYKLNEAAHPVIIESDNEVLFADGTVAKMTIMCLHDNDVSNINVGDKLKQGDVFYQMGTAADPSVNITGAHIHVEIAKGSYKDVGASKVKAQMRKKENAVHLYDALFLYEGTEIVSNKGVEKNFKTVSDIDDNIIAFNNSIDYSVAGYYYLTTNYARIGRTPAAASDTIGSLSHGEIFYVYAAGKNTYNNTWYKTTNGYVYPYTDDDVYRFKKIGQPFVLRKSDVKNYVSSYATADYVCCDILINNGSLYSGYTLSDTTSFGCIIYLKINGIMTEICRATDDNANTAGGMFYNVSQNPLSTNKKFKTSSGDQYYFTPGQTYYYRMFVEYEHNNCGIVYSRNYAEDSDYFTFVAPGSSAVTLSSISVKTMPSKTVYLVGEEFNPAGLTLTAKYSDGSTKTISSGYSISGFSSNTVGEKTVTVSYQGKSTTFKVTVSGEAKLTASVSSLYLNLNGTNVADISVTASGSLPNTFHISFCSEYGNCSITYGDWIGSTAPFTVTGIRYGTDILRFWLIDAESGDDVAYTEISVTIDANKYAISYDANGGGDAPSAQTKYYNTDLILSTQIPTKYYTISYHANGGSVSPSYKTVYCTFDSWNTKQDGSGTSYSAGGTYSANAAATLYAQWTNPKAGTLPTPTLENHTFLGWFTAADGGTEVTASTTITNGMALYAHWKANSTLLSISIKTMPDKTVYRIGESLDTTGLTIRAQYNDHAETIILGFTTSALDSSTAGEKTITVTYEGKTTTFTVTVVDDTVQHATLHEYSFNTVWVNGQQVCDVFFAEEYLNENPIVGDVFSIGLRGWAWLDNYSIQCFGYSISGSEPVFSNSFLEDRADVQSVVGVTAEYANGFCIYPINVSGLANGNYTVTVLVKATNGDILSIVTVPFTISRNTPDPDSPTVEAEQVFAAPGKEVSVKVYLKNNPGISYMRLTPSYDSSVMTLIGVDFTGAEVSFDNADYTLNVTLENGSDVSGDGLVFTMKFRIADNAEEGVYPVSVIFREAYDLDESPVSFSVVSGSVEIVSFIYGDVNGDGTIDGRDLIRLRKYLGTYDDETGTSPYVIFAGSDCNGDGRIDGRDLIRLRKYLGTYDDETGTSPIVLGP